MRKQRKAIKKSMSKNGRTNIDSLSFLAAAAQGVFRRISARKLKAKSPADRCLLLSKMSNCCASEQFLRPLILLKTG